MLQEIAQNTGFLPTMLQAVSHPEALAFTLTALALLCIFLAGIWLKLQPQPFFLHLILFNLMLLAELALTAMPAGVLPPWQPGSAGLHLTHGLYLTSMLLWLALAPIRFGRPLRGKAVDIVRRRSLWMLVSVVVLILSAMAENRHWLPFSGQYDPSVWVLPFGGCLIAGIAVSQRNFKTGKKEFLLYVSLLAAFTVGAFLSLRGLEIVAKLALIAGSASLVLHILIYHKRFVGIEAELRTGLYDENLTLREENIIQSNILAHTREAVLQLDRDEIITYANPAFAKITGFTLRALKGRRFSDVISKNFYEAASRALKSARSGREEIFEIMLHRAEGPDLALQVQAVPLYDPRQKFKGVHLGFFEMTESVKTRENLLARLEEQERVLRLYHTALNRAEDAMIVTDTSCRILFVSHSFAGISGYNSGDLIGRSTKIYRADVKSEKQAVNTLKQGKIWKGNLENRRKDGSGFVVDVYATPLLEDEGEVQYILWIERDASRRLSAERDVEQAQQKLTAQAEEFKRLREEQTAILAGLETGIILVLPDGACRFLNQRAAAILGITAETISIKNLPTFVRDLLRMGANYGAKMRSEAIDFVDEFLRPDGEKKLLRWHALPIISRSNHYLGVILQIFDITEFSAREKRAEVLEKELEQIRRQHVAIDTSRLHRLQSILEVAEGVHLPITFNESMQLIAETAQKLGWQHLLIYEKKPGSTWYENIGKCGFRPRLVNALHALPVRDVDQYFQERFAIAGGYFLKTEALNSKGSWDFLPIDLQLPATGAWKSRDLLLLPLKIKGRRVGIFLCGAREDGKIPAPEAVQELEKLALYAAFSIDQGQRQLLIKEKLIQNKLLMDISKIEPVDARPERELAQIVKNARSIVRGEVCLVTYGPPAIGACTVAAKGNRSAVRQLETGELEEIIRQIRPKLPSSGAASVDLTAGDSALLQVMKLRLQSTGDIRMLIAPLVLRRKKHGFICCTLPNGKPQEELVDFISELAYRTALLTDNAQLFSEIEAKAQELEQANTYISEFLANVSHELRTPLHTILSYVELLRQKKEAPQEDRIRHLHTIQNSGNKLLRLINDLLDLSKIEAGKMEPELETFDPRILVEEVGEDIATLCHTSGLNLKISVNKAMPPLIVSDKNILSRILLNLARNAQKFTNEGGTVEISAATTAAGHLLLQVRDTGIGISKNDLKKIFEPFNQLDRKTSRRYEGTGLGLPISRRLVELLGGRITVQSRKGQGATFTVEVPVQQIWRKPRMKAVVDQRAAGWQRRKSGKKSRQILLVDDDLSTKEAMQFLLENSGYQVEFAHDGPTAISTAQHLRPDLILLDIMMPGMDGYQVARTIKAQKHLNRIPLVALTARAMNEDRDKALGAGFDDFLTKPFAMDDFFRVVKKYVGA